MATSTLPPLPRTSLTSFGYRTPLIALPVCLVLWIMYGATPAQFAFVASLAIPVITLVSRSQKAQAREPIYARYVAYRNFLDALKQAIAPYASSDLPPQEATDFDCLYSELRPFFNPPSTFPTFRLDTLSERTFAPWEAAFFKFFREFFPNHQLTPETLRSLPAAVANDIHHGKEMYTQAAFDHIPAYLSLMHATSLLTASVARLSLSATLQHTLADVQQDYERVAAATSAVMRLLFEPPPTRDPDTFHAHYLEQLRGYFYGRQVEVSRGKFETRHYNLAMMSPDLERYLHAFDETRTALFAAVRDKPTAWLDIYRVFAETFHRDVIAHLSHSHGFILGFTATVPQPDITTLPPYAITLTPSERRTHTYVIGRTGSGKTTLLKNLITQDLRNDQQGVVVLSPENKIFEDLLDLVPPERAHSLIYFDPTDTRPPVIGFNPFTFEDGDDLNQKAQETYTIFERALGDLGVKMTTMLQNAAYALIQRKNSRLIDLDTLLNPSNNSLRHRVARDPAIDERTRNFWQSYDSSAYYKSAYEPVVNRLDPFFRPPHATILSTNSFSWDDVLNKKPHIIFCNLSRLKGVEAQIMGQLLIAQIQQTIFHRDPKPESSYIPYALYIDEFQTYATTGEQSFIETMNKARKYHFALTLAHQVTSDIPPKLLSSIVGNVGTVIALRTSAEDAPFFAKDLQIKDAEGHSRPDLLQNLPIGQAIVRTPSHNIGIAIGVPAAPPPLQRDTPGPSIPRLADTYAATLKTLSKRNFGTQPEITPPPVEIVPPQPIFNATTAPAADNDGRVIFTAPDSLGEDNAGILVDETENPLNRVPRRRGRPPKRTTADPTPAPPRRRRISPNGDGTNE